METGKTSRYFKYAIGEIILVVIGILIAVQINSWHQGNLRLKQEKVLLQQLRLEILEVYDDILSDYKTLSLGEESHFRVLDAIENNLDYTDSLAFDFYFLKQDEYIYPNTAVYEKLKELGLDIIKNDSLRNDIQLLYDQEFPRISKANSFTRDISEYLDPYYVEHFRPNDNYNLSYDFFSVKDSLGGRVFTTREIKFPIKYKVNGETRLFTFGFIPNDFEALKNDNQFLMLLHEADRNRNYKLGRYLEAKNRIKAMVGLIDNLLSND